MNGRPRDRRTTRQPRDRRTTRQPRDQLASGPGCRQPRAVPAGGGVCADRRRQPGPPQRRGRLDLHRDREVQQVADQAALQKPDPIARGCGPRHRARGMAELERLGRRHRHQVGRAAGGVGADDERRHDQGRHPQQHRHREHAGHQHRRGADLGAGLPRRRHGRSTRTVAVVDNGTAGSQRPHGRVVTSTVTLTSVAVREMPTRAPGGASAMARCTAT